MNLHYRAKRWYVLEYYRFTWSLYSFEKHTKLPIDFINVYFIHDSRGSVNWCKVWILGEFGVIFN